MKAVLEQRRDCAIGHAADHAHHQHGNQRQRRLPGGKHDRHHAAENGAHGQLAFGADVPHIGEITHGKAGADQHQRRCLHQKLLDRPLRRERLDEIDIERIERIEAAQRKDDGAGDHREQ